MKTMKEQLSAALDAVTNHLREQIKEQYTGQAEKTYAKILETVNKEKGYRQYVGVQLIEFNEIGEEKVIKEAGQY